MKTLYQIIMKGFNGIECIMTDELTYDEAWALCESYGWEFDDDGDEWELYIEAME